MTLACVLGSCAALGQTIPLDQAADAFALARQISSRDAGGTWGLEVCGPMLIGDAANHVVANQGDTRGQLRRAGDVWQGELPASIHVSNTALEWAGIRWTMVMWPLPADARERAQLLAHECYHRIQPAIQLPATDSVSGHLDSMQGRIWMLLEWRALERALLEHDESRTAAVADALLFRRYRRLLIKNSAEPENALELNEGLAEYTGIRLANPDPADRRGAALFMLRDGPRRASLVRSFAYASGPAYGVLLDEAGKSWRGSLTPASDLGVMLGEAYRATAAPVSEALALRLAEKYDGEAIRAQESLRARKAENELADLRARFVTGPVLVLPVLNEFNFSFNPNALFPLNESSVVYRPLRASDQWGVLEASGGGMMVREGGSPQRVIVPAPVGGLDKAQSADGWELQLKPGFKIEPGQRAGDYVVRRE